MSLNFYVYRKRHRRGYWLRWLCLILSAVSLLVCITATAHLRPIMNSMATARVSNVVHKAITEAVTETISTGAYDYDDLISLEKDNDGRITALTSNMARFNRLQIDVSENVLKKVGSVSGSELAIPAGSLTGIALLAGRGPEFHVRVLSVGMPSTEFENLFTDAGINQTKHRIVLNVEVVVSILMPGYTTSTVVESSLAVAETVIVGAVPETYTYFQSGSVDDVREYVTNQ